MRVFCSLLLAACLLRAEPADSIWSARYVVTVDGHRRVIENGAVAIRGDRIVAVDTRAAIDKRFQTRNRLHRPNALIAPGLVNTHTHAAMSLFRGIADDLRLQEWLEKYIFPAEAKNVSPDFVKWGTLLACVEMLLSGTTTYADMYYFEDVVAEATKQAGMRGVLGQTIIGFPVPDAKTPQDALRSAEQFIRRYEKDPLIVPAVAPHAIYTNSDETLRASRELANRYGVPLLIHLAETRREVDDVRAKRGVSPVKALDSLGILQGRTLAAHCVWVDEEDMAVLKSRGVGVAHCPSSNMKLASGTAPVARMLELDMAVGLGPDGPAGSNNDFNLFEEMDLAAKLQKLATGDPQAVSAAQALEMATIRGARALGLEKQIGSIEPGKLADLITVRIDGSHAIPLYNVVSQLVYALKASDVEDVMVNGRTVVRSRQVLTVNQKELAGKVGEFRARISSSLR